MTGVGRIVIMAEMHGRDLVRRHIALGLLVALPLSFYLASAGKGRQSLPAGGVGMAFAVGGAALFSALSSLAVDQRLVLAGYRPIELLLGRLMFLGPLGIVIAGLFTALMTALSDPASPAALLLGLVVVAVQAVPFGLAVAALVPRELEGTLLLIGVVGVQLAVGPEAVVAKLLPFYGPRRIIDIGVSGHGSVWGPLGQTALYAIGLFVIARVFVGARLSVRRHGPTDGD
ncbi:MAG TPA: hypothetical protein VGN18_08105 [Jatrophihabitans sp.]|jgi:hypothetical protein|uniref:hypothetical protein n=1 Tax=Jatrophihabitans sp. TaxID=1932789 RepID=UPI002E045272|nr:hypothetical protein [Jatrophihabitans sp.]